MALTPDNLRNLDEALTKRLGKSVGETVSQRGVSFQCGHSRIHVSATSIRGRMEGGEGSPTTWDDLPIPFTGTTLKEFIAWAVTILAPGRTVEVGPGVGIRALAGSWPHAKTCDMGVAEILHHIDGTGDRRAWDLNPDYQRGHVWTTDQAEKFMGHFIEGGPIPPVYVQRYESSENAPAEIKATYYDHAEVVDGQQRLRAVKAWVKGDIDAVLSNGRRIRYADLDEVDLRMLRSLQIAFIDMSRKDRLDFYIKLNRGGTVHSDAEIDRVRVLRAAEGV